MNNTIIACIIFLLCFGILNTNPIPISGFYLNELLLDPDDSHNWRLEIINKYTDQDDLSGYYLSSNSDTAYFRDDINWDKDYIVITQDSLKSTLSINLWGHRL